ncbi:hypothetical protein H9Q09_16665 [Aurantimonas sp. DM33-3]|uniref:hypothetical protein n=1 Tax=Aurantimonas sp. DM33-3 TaxID=2766955 RepID=UPI001651BB16|nr:hypothetical protein [Aurantimonas sp. DM33-3]MBC6717826.1 hypothetical protein [Aurantimonas sp. DM33-3]
MEQLPEGRALRPREWRWCQVRRDGDGPEERGDKRPNARLSPSVSRAARAASPVIMASSRIGAGQSSEPPRRVFAHSIAQARRVLKYAPQKFAAGGFSKVGPGR